MYEFTCIYSPLSAIYKKKSLFYVRRHNLFYFFHPVGILFTVEAYQRWDGIQHSVIRFKVSAESPTRSTTSQNVTLGKDHTNQCFLYVCVVLQKRGSTSVTCVLTQPSAGLTSISTWPSTLSSWWTPMPSRSSALLQPTRLSARTARTTTGGDHRPGTNSTPTHDDVLSFRKGHNAGKIFGAK